MSSPAASSPGPSSGSSPGSSSGLAGVPAGDGLVRNVRIGRQGVYDVRRRLMAYELLFRSLSQEPAAGERATSQVIAATFGTFGLDKISDGRPVFINFTRAFLTGIIPIPVGPERVVLEVVENVAVDQELLLGLGQLRQAGYRIAVGDYRGRIERAPLLEVADYLKIDISVVPQVLLPGLAAVAREAAVALVATGVEDDVRLEQCADLGFELFQGPLLQRPVLLEQRTLSPTQVICVRLLNDLADPEMSISQVARLVGSDPGLTLRLLRSANSSAVAANHAITSLSQALVLIGPLRLRSWVVLTLLEGGITVNVSEDLWSVLARAYACRRLAERDGDVAFTVGLLSGAAQLLGAEPGLVAEAAGVGSDALAALVDRVGQVGRALAAVLAHEHDDPAAVRQLGLEPFDVSRAYLESLSESLALVHDITNGR
jgi:EAL and modified HD-GYP domain-containing signal transduction protein